MKFSNEFNRFFKLKSSTTAAAQGDYTAALITILLFAFIILIVVIFYFLRKKYDSLEYKNFNTLAKSAGLNFDEVKLLFNLISKYRIKYPMTCFTNAKLLDDILKKGIKEIHNSRSLNAADKNEKVDEMIDIKMKIEANSKKNIGIKSTHLVSENQKIIVFVRNKGYFYAIVVKNLKDFLVIEFISNLIDKRVLLKDEFFKVYFWRQEDAGYIFESKILDYGQNIRTYLISHSDKLVRSQKRKYKRIPVSFAAMLSPIEKKKDNSYTILSDLATRCNIADLSAGGMRIITDRMDERIKVYKIEFEINNRPVSVISKLVRINNKQNNVKEVTLQYIKLTIESKNTINSFIYNYLPVNI